MVKIARLFPAGKPFNWDDPFIKRAFTDGERAQAKEREGDEARKAYIAARFAGKEAVFKAISQCVRGFEARDIEVVDGADGRPVIAIRGKTGEALSAALFERGEQISLDVSLTFENEYAAACASALFIKRN